MEDLEHDGRAEARNARRSTRPPSRRRDFGTPVGDRPTFDNPSRTDVGLSIIHSIPLSLPPRSLVPH